MWADISLALLGAVVFFGVLVAIVALARVDREPYDGGDDDL